MRLYELLNLNEAIGDDDWSSGLDPRLEDNLTSILSNAAQSTGLSIQTTSGQRDLNPATGRDTAGSTSGRHTHGHASDTALIHPELGQLSVNNPEHVPHIQEFTKQFLNISRNQGYNPSVGIGTEYMGGNVFHYDIASGLNSRPNGNEISGTYWGNDSVGDGAIDWLPSMFNDPNEFEIKNYTPSTPMSDRRVADAGSFTNYATDVAPAISTPQPTKTIDPRFDMSSLSNVGTTQYNLRSGSRGENVTQLQTQLQNLGYDVGTTGADGKFGRNTAAAVRQFQTDYGLQTDSIAGDQTMSALQQATSLKVEPPKSDFTASTTPTPPTNPGQPNTIPDLDTVSTPRQVRPTGNIQ